MNVTLILPTLSTTATSIRGLNYARFLTKRGHRVNLVLPAGDPIQFNEIKGIKCVPSSFLAIPYIMNKKLHIRPSMLRQRFGPFLLEDEVIHSFKPALSGINSLLSKYLKNQKILLDLEDFESAFHTCRAGGFIGNLIVKFLERMLPKHVNGIIVASKELEKWIYSVCGVTANVFYLPIGTKVSNFINVKGDNHELLRKYRVDSGPLILYIGGQIRKEYDTDIVIYAMKEVSKQKPNSRLLIVGGGPYINYLKKLVDTLKLREYIIFTGFIPYEKIPNLLSAADVVTLPMRDNLLNRMRFPTKLCEYLAAGKPIVTNAVGEVKYIIQDGINGFLASTGSWKSFARKIILALSNESLSRKIGKNARKLAWRYDITVVGTRLEEIYRTIKSE